MRVGIHNPLTIEEDEKINEIGRKIILKAYDQNFWDRIEKSPMIVDIKRKLSDSIYEYRISYSIDGNPIYIWIDNNNTYWFQPLFYRKTNMVLNKEKKIAGLISEL